MADSGEPIFPLRERSLFEVHDLALSLVRRFPWQLLLTGLPGALLLTAIGWTIAGFSEVSPRAEDEGLGVVVRLFAWLVLWLAIEPIATLPVTAWLADATFQGCSSPGQVLQRVRQRLGRLLPRTLLWRWLPLAAALALWQLAPWTWFLMLPMLVLVAVLGHLGTEIILLEGQDLKASRKRRSRFAGERPGAALGEVLLDLLAMALALAVLGGAAVSFLDLLWSGSPIEGGTLHFLDPGGSALPWILAWPVSVFLATVRFLVYLNIRTRLEGWEVETGLRLAAERLRGGLAR